MSEHERTASELPALTFVAPSGTGKTTLLEAVLEHLVREGVSVAVLKASHHDHDLDVEGKDSWRFQRAGAACVGLCGPQRATFFLASGRSSWPSLRACARWFAASPIFDVDLLICEGFSDDDSVGKLRVVRGELPSPLPAHDDLVALCWDAFPGAERPPELPAEVACLPLDAAAVAQWILRERMGRS